MIREANSTDLNKIYEMGFDVWSEGKSLKRYLQECQASPKYKRGTWWVYANGDILLSSLIVYELGEHIYGIGSIATPPELRKNGFASRLVNFVVNDIEGRDASATIFLYADIHPKFYEKLGFVILPKEAQRYEKSKCMIRGQNIQSFLTDPRINPEYF